ncbi:MAG TPA: FISUMP domain-containing protein [bacterium]|nr:FISUMP domain-containing protein [bacterium]
MFKTNKPNKPAFTLVELLVVIAIIGIISTLAVVSLTNARKSARDAKRMADVKQIQTALELYYQDNGEYPSTITNSIATSGNIYMQSFPTAPTPADGDCTDTDNTYTYTSSNGSSYTIEFCIGSNVAELSKGLKVAIPGGITNPTPWTCGVDNLVDSRDSNTYTTVQIGTQCWMKKNLAYLPEVNSNTEFEAKGASSSPAYGVPEYDGSDVATAKAQTNYTTYGALYNFFAVDQVSICPTGWHVPSDAEWTTLTNYLSANSEYWCGANSAQINKSLANTSGWISSATVCQTGNDQGSNNTTGFSALPAGNRDSSGPFYQIGYRAFFWSSSVNYDAYIWYRSFYYNSAEVYVDARIWTNGFSVRCLKDL